MKIEYGKGGFKSMEEGYKVMRKENRAVLYVSDNLLVGDTASWAKEFFDCNTDNGNFPQYSNNGVPISEYLHQLNCRLSHGTLRKKEDGTIEGKKSVHIYTTLADRKDAKQKVCLLDFKEKEDTFVVRKSSVSRGTKEAFFYNLLSERLQKKSKDFRLLKNDTEIRFPPERAKEFVEVVNQLIRDNEENKFKLYIKNELDEILDKALENGFKIEIDETLDQKTKEDLEKAILRKREEELGKRFEKIQVEGKDRYFNIGEWHERDEANHRMIWEKLKELEANQKRLLDLLARNEEEVVNVREQMTGMAEEDHGGV